MRPLKKLKAHAYAIEALSFYHQRTPAYQIGENIVRPPPWNGPQVFSSEPLEPPAASAQDYMAY